MPNAQHQSFSSPFRKQNKKLITQICQEGDKI